MFGTKNKINLYLYFLIKLCIRLNLQICILCIRALGSFFFCFYTLSHHLLSIRVMNGRSFVQTTTIKDSNCNSNETYYVILVWKMNLESIYLVTISIFVKLIFKL